MATMHGEDLRVWDKRMPGTTPVSSAVIAGNVVHSLEWSPRCVPASRARCCQRLLPPCFECLFSFRGVGMPFADHQSVKS